MRARLYLSTGRPHAALLRETVVARMSILVTRTAAHALGLVEPLYAMQCNAMQRFTNWPQLVLGLGLLVLLVLVQPRKQHSHMLPVQLDPNTESMHKQG